MRSQRQVSFVMATHNRRDVALATLEKLAALDAETRAAEMIVVDNASTDGTADAIRSCLRQVRLIVLDHNLGSCAKAIGVDRANGEYVVFLDDDACPRPGSTARMTARFEADPRLGAAGFTVHLPDGRREGAALPDVFVGCGVGFRREALRSVGGLDRTLFMQAEEYDLAFRLVRAGWTVRTLADLHVDHLKTPSGRLSGRTVYHDTRNNLLVAARYVPEKFEVPLLQDYTQRYRWIAGSAGQLRDYERGRREGWRRRATERRRHACWRLTGQAFESLFRFGEIGRQMTALGQQGVRRVVFADLGKNIYPFVQAAREAGIEVTCIADDRFAQPGRTYRGIPVRTVAEALDPSPEAIVVSNTSPVQAETCAQRFAHRTTTPISQWFVGPIKTRLS